jgi:hypothetical protein
MLTDQDEGALSRQEQIWASMYGPSNAASFVATARALRLEAPDRDLKEIFRTVEPEDDIDPDEAGTFRPAVG